MHEEIHSLVLDALINDARTSQRLLRSQARASIVVLGLYAAPTLYGVYSGKYDISGMAIPAGIIMAMAYCYLRHLHREATASLERLKRVRHTIALKALGVQHAEADQSSNC